MALEIKKKYLNFIRKFLLHDLWHLELEQFSRLRAFIYRIIRLTYLVIKEFFKDQLLVQAGSLVYSTLFAIVPFLVVLFYILKAFGHQDMIEQTLHIALKPLGNQIMNTIIPRILEFVKNTNLGTIGIVGFVILLVTLISIFFTIETSFNLIWCRPCKRTWRSRLLIYAGLILIGPVLVVITIGVTTFGQASGYFESFQQVPFLKNMLQKLFPMALSWLVIFIFIYIMPSAKVKLKSALFGTLISGTLWHLVNLGIADYMVSVYESGTQAVIYTSFAALPLLLFWMFFGWCAMLLASEIAYAHQHLRKLVLEEKYKRLSFVYHEGIVLRILLLITRAFQHGQRAPSIETLSMAMEIPEQVVIELVQILIKRNIIRPFQGDPTRYIPVRDPKLIPVSEVLLALRQGEDESEMLQIPISFQILQLQSKVNEAIERAAQDLSCADLN